MDLFNSIKMSSTLRESERVKYNNIPFNANARFSGHEEILTALGKYLDPESHASVPKSMALFGMGGVGKTQIAIQYVYHELETFDVILWISADNAISIGQSFRIIANGLGLLESEEEKRDVAVATYKVKKWLATTSSLLYSNTPTLVILIL